MRLKTNSWPFNTDPSTGKWSFLDSVTSLRRCFEHYAWGIYAINLVGCFLSAQGLVVAHARPLLVVPLIGSFFQNILLQSHVCNFNTLAMSMTLLGLQHK